MLGTFWKTLITYLERSPEDSSKSRLWTVLEVLTVTFDNTAAACLLDEFGFAVVLLGGLKEKLALRWSKLDFCWCTKNAFVGGE